VKALSNQEPVDPAQAFEAGLGTADDPIFPGMYEASLAYVAGSAAAARAVNDGANLAFGLAGGLHHARRAQASGFCVFNDPAVAAHILREKHDRVAYVDIDVHHGDGVQWIWYDDPRVLTCSIHEEGRTLYPGTGSVEEQGPSCTSFNVPLRAHTTGDVWIDAFERTILPALNAFQPQAIVLQMGTDPHFLDPLGHLRLSSQEWLAAVSHVKALGLPIVAVGGGGYNLTTVPRMWVAACLTLLGEPVPDQVPEPFATEWDMPTFFDRELPGPRGNGSDHAEAVIAWLEDNALPKLAAR
jgi:acetoin utilization protein AcuC